MVKKFDAIDYLVKKYVDDGEHATIPIILEDKNDFFNKYDPTCTTLSSEVYHYLDKCAYNIPLQYKIRINVVCDDLDDATKIKMEKALSNFYGLNVFNNDLDINDSSRKSLILAVLGLVILWLMTLGDSINMVGDFLNITKEVIHEILTITGWVFIWASLENITFKNKKLIENKKDNIQMLNAQVLFETREEYFKRNKKGM